MENRIIRLFLLSSLVIVGCSTIKPTIDPGQPYKKYSKLIITLAPIAINWFLGNLFEVIEPVDDAVCYSSVPMSLKRIKDGHIFNIILSTEDISTGSTINVYMVRLEKDSLQSYRDLDHSTSGVSKNSIIANWFLGDVLGVAHTHTWAHETDSIRMEF